MKTTVVHCKKEPYDVYIGRPSEFGNPYSHKEGTSAKYKVATREEAIAKYEDYICGRPDLLAQLPQLRGKRLACWCAPQPCHGDVLVRLIEQLDEMSFQTIVVTGGRDVHVRRGRHLRHRIHSDESEGQANSWHRVLWVHRQGLHDPSLMENLALRFLVEVGETRDDYADHCGELVDAMIHFYGEHRVGVLYVESSQGLLHVSGERWDYHMVAVVGGLAHDAWAPKLVLPPVEYVRRAFPDQEVDWDIDGLTL